jgi:hypothetical protein
MLASQMNFSPPQNPRKRSPTNDFRCSTPNYSPRPQEFGSFGDLITSAAVRTNHASPDLPSSSRSKSRRQHPDLFATASQAPAKNHCSRIPRSNFPSAVHHRA